MPWKNSRRELGLWGLFAIQSLCAAYFLADAVGDISGYDFDLNTRYGDLIENLVVIALILSLVFTVLEIGRVLGRQKRMEAQLTAASGAFADLLEEHFDDWGLTPSERDVALLAIKGLTIADIARLRETKDGTIKAQCNAIYRKAGVNGRPQLLSLLIEELIMQGMTEPEASVASAST